MAVARRFRDNERGDAALIGCAGLAAFFLLLGLAVIDYWSTLSVDRNLLANRARCRGCRSLWH